MSQDEIHPPSSWQGASILQQLIIQSINNLPQSRSLTELWTAGYNSSADESKNDMK